ncbi:RNA-directed DNA polymerase, eukaryota, reverse transcriptase zinc-binding domain protein [Tanacetum coccineum]
MQIDIQKAYDTVSWSFLEDILGKFGFYKKMITWIMTCVKSTSFSIYLNGDMHGFFKGGRGLRQGDPISPYLFTLVMEVFSLIMEKNIEESSGFGYHFGCKELKLSHMCFADDLLVLCKGNRESIELPVDILGASYLICKRTLGVSDCKVLCNKVEERINNWRNKTLSYAGRIQLISYVLSSMQQYWALVYLLPATVIHDLEKLFKRFLWNAGDSAKGKARVSWQVVCKPKDQGGLGIKSLKKWNEVLLIRQFWKIIEVKDSLWAKWVNIVKDRIRDHVWYEIGNGNNVSMWYDKWCIDGLLSSVISRRDIYDARLDDNARVVDMIRDNQWVWHDGWKENYTILSNLSRTVNLVNNDDKVIWVTNAGDKVKFNTKQA